MNPIRRLAVPALLLFLGCAVASVAADTAKEARGIVTSIRQDSIMINLPSDVDLVFRLEPDTHVVARGAGKKMRRAEEEGARGITVADVRSVLPIGSAVKVSYEERAGQRYARRIVSVSSPGR